MKIITHTIKATEQLGIKIAKTLKTGDILGIRGPLGAGKTHLIKGIAKGLNIKQKITSPTFVMLRDYGTFCHVDAYRETAKLKEIKEYLADKKTITVVEWPEKFKLKYTKIIKIAVIDQNTRAIADKIIKQSAKFKIEKSKTLK